ncbi:MAG: 6-phosphofructokinase [Kiritimatiellia bacterium]|jgi:6-phosphofructokinase
MKENVLIAQSGGPSMVINQSLVGAVTACLGIRCAGKIYGALHGIQGILDDRLIDFRKESRKNLERVAATPSSALGSVRRKPDEADCAKILEALRARDISHFFYIGGNDSAETAHLVARAAEAAGDSLSCIHIPKTIDNDLRANDHTPGYGSAAKFVACAVLGDDLDNRAMGGVKIDVIMGRHAGFLAAASALARVAPDSGPHLIYLPERPFSMEKFVKDVQRVMKRLGRCVVAVSEGIADKDGVPVAAAFSKETDSHGNLQLSGTGALGDLLANHLKKATDIRRVRADTFGYLQRSFVGVVSETDAEEARRVGQVAVAAAFNGISRGSVTIQRKPGKRYEPMFVIQPLEEVAKFTRPMPREFISRSGNDVTQAFLDYARPLVGALPPVGFLAAVKA